MRKMPAQAGLVLVLTLAISGCYTILNAPRTTGGVQPEVWKSTNQQPAARQFSEEDDFYRYPGDIYGYGRAPYGTSVPYIGYDSSAGMYGYGSFGYPGHAYGYGPYGYGADPYYVDSGGYYLPPGYDLVSTRELEEMRDTIHYLTGQQSDPVQQAREEEFRRRQEEEREQVFQTRINPSRTRAVDAAPYVPPATVRKASSSGGGGGSSKSSSSGSSKSGTDIKSKSKRRRGR